MFDDPATPGRGQSAGRCDNRRVLRLPLSVLQASAALAAELAEGGPQAALCLQGNAGPRRRHPSPPRMPHSLPERQGKYEAFHTAMMATKGQITDETVYKVAGSVGLDVDRLKQDMSGAGDRAGAEGQSGARRRARYPRHARFHHRRPHRPRRDRPRCPEEHGRRRAKGIACAQRAAVHASQSG